MYSIDQFLSPPPLSAIFSLLLFMGCDFIGSSMLPFFGLSDRKITNWQRWQAPVIGALVLGLFLYPMALCRVTTMLFLRVVAAALMLLGLFQCLKVIPTITKWSKTLGSFFDLRHLSKNIWLLLLLFILIGLFLLALGPVTDADSLDYHLGIPIAIINHSGMPVIPEWFSGRLGGNGEVLNALGLSVGAEQLGSVLQFAGVLGVTAILLFSESPSRKNVWPYYKKEKVFMAIAAISAPVILALITPKPQLLPISMTTLAFALLIFPSRRQLSAPQAFRGFLLVCLLVMFASQTKLIYTLSGGLIGLSGLALMAKRGLLAGGVVIALFSAVLVILPPVVWKHIYYNAGFLEAVLKPLPGNWAGTAAFENYLRSFRDSDMPFPLSLLVPASLGTITTVIGAGLLFLVALRPKNDRWLILGALLAVIVAVVAAMVGPKGARSYLEPYFWILIVISLQPTESLIWKHPLLRLPIAGQALITLLFCWYGVVTLLPGSITEKLRVVVMNNSANGYTILKWADSVLPRDAVLLNTHRSMALAPRDAVKIDWAEYVDINKPESAPYLQQLKNRGISYIIAIGKPPPDLGKLSVCVGDIVAGPCYGRLATRNPLNKGQLYEAWIYKFDSTKLP